MEIVIFSRDDYIRSSVAQNITKRERNTVSRTSDSNYGFRGIDVGGIGYTLECTIFSKLDKHFDFDIALKSHAYWAYNNIAICSSFSLVNTDTDNYPDNDEVTELYSSLSIPFAEINILPYLYSYDLKPYDVFSLLKEKLQNTDEDKIDPETFFISRVLVDSGFSEVLHDCSPRLDKINLMSTIQLKSTITTNDGSTIKVSKQSNIQLYETFRKV